MQPSISWFMRVDIRASLHGESHTRVCVSARAHCPWVGTVITHFTGETSERESAVYDLYLLLYRESELFLWDFMVFARAVVIVPLNPVHTHTHTHIPHTQRQEPKE